MKGWRWGVIYSVCSLAEILCAPLPHFPSVEFKELSGLCEEKYHLKAYVAVYELLVYLMESNSLL